MRKTREALYTAFLALIARDGFDRVTVQDIIDEADVGRTTFYAHFRTKEDLLHHGFDRLRRELIEIVADKTENGWAFVEPLLAHARSHRGLYKALADGGGGVALAEAEFGKVVEELVYSAMRGSASALDVAMMSGALLSGIKHWLAGSADPVTQAGIGARVRQLAEAMATRKEGP